MDLFHALIFGVVEGVTEFLPVSSTGHLILTARILGVSQNDFMKSFEVAIQCGAIGAVILLYGKTLLRDFRILKKILLAFIPTAVLGLIFYKVIKHFLLGSQSAVLWSLFLGGIFLIVFEIIHREKKDATRELSAVTYQQAFWVGIFQSLAMIPGVSRAAATIIGGLILGFKRKTIVEFSFLLAIPTMIAATGLDLLKSAHTFSLEQFIFLGVGSMVSFGVALLSIKFLLQYIKSHNFTAFGIYRIVIALLFWIWIK